jgi:hypothetical protein
MLLSSKKYANSKMDVSREEEYFQRWIKFKDYSFDYIHNFYPIFDQIYRSLLFGYRRLSLTHIVINNRI